MALFGRNKDEELMARLYVLASAARKRLLQADILSKHWKQVSEKAPWIEDQELLKMEQALRKYAFSLVSEVYRQLDSLPTIRGGPFLNMAIQPEEELEMVQRTYGDAAREIVRLADEFEETDSGVPSASQVLGRVLGSDKK